MDFLIMARNILLATLPGLFWFWWYVRQDNKRPEPKGYLWRVFLLGALVTIPALFLEFVFALFVPYVGAGLSLVTILGTFLIVAPIEELAKFFMVYAGVYQNKAFDERVDGIIYMIVAALGFATIENILVVLREGITVLPLRFLTATLLHVLASGVIGFFLGQAKFMTSRVKAGWTIVMGIAIGIFLHAIYDFLVLTDSNLKLTILFIFLLLLYLVLDASVRYSRWSDGAKPHKH